MIIPKYRKYSAPIIRIGLGLVFLANSYAAFVAPDHLTEHISESFLANLLPINLDLLIKFIGISDFVVAALLLIGRWQVYVASYGALWLIGVMIVIGINEPTELLEHLGFLSMAIYLLLN